MTIAVANRINDLQSVLRTTEDHSLTQLQEIGQEIDTWQTKVNTMCILARSMPEVFCDAYYIQHTCSSVCT